ncbi:MAG: LysR family transcriptional regulator [Alicyclobacillus macrosporangiidus]|uniref:LysR family transcriptional regulator n=1 Tax=Alicyclobacillus macrosporangiidus TaxID=392015 RepID=UPI0026EEDD1C|nr:LysR family transcriptional regulator [Alicyclobacillus macrosporangiidus]MCL6600473.1 LysR family transcriptional regulator [Alicyclobacillus macrosporangiidus]
MDIDIRQLRYFLKVAQHLNFTEAANELYVAQSAVSQQIADLEKKIGVTLFVRNKRSVRLTSAGMRFFDDVSDIVGRVEEAVHNAQLVQSGIVGSLKVGFLAPHVRAFLPNVIKRFRDAYPDVELNLNHYHHGMLIRAIENGELDLAITTPFGLHRIEGIQVERILTEPFYVVLHRQHPLASRQHLRISELKDEKFIIHNRQDSPVGFFDFTLQLCAKNGFTPNIVSQPRFVDTVLVLVESDIGIALLPKSLEQHYSTPNLKFIPLADCEEHSLDLVMVWKNDNQNPSLPIFLNVFRESIAQGLDNSY